MHFRFGIGFEDQVLPVYLCVVFNQVHIFVGIYAFCLNYNEKNHSHLCWAWFPQLIDWWRCVLLWDSSALQCASISVEAAPIELDGVPESSLQNVIKIYVLIRCFFMLFCAEIMAGNVLLFNNNLLCWENTINWKDILTGERAEVIHHNDSPHTRVECKRTFML